MANLFAHGFSTSTDSAQGSKAAPCPKKQKLDKDTEYDRNKRSRKFLHEWTSEFPWLEYDEKEGKMFCKFCKAYPGLAGKDFVDGSTSFHKGTIKGQQGSRAHDQCHKLFIKHRPVTDDQTETTCSLSVPTADPKQNQLPAVIRKMTESQIEGLKCMFRTAFYLATHARPFTDFPDLCQLQVINGVIANGGL
jgi:hypothetical protein